MLNNLINKLLCNYKVRQNFNNFKTSVITKKDQRLLVKGESTVGEEGQGELKARIYEKIKEVSKPKLLHSLLVCLDKSNDSNNDK